MLKNKNFVIFFSQGSTDYKTYEGKNMNKPSKQAPATSEKVRAQSKQNKALNQNKAWGQLEKCAKEKFCKRKTCACRN